ncbi:zinc-binding alcohol dehydrogenase [Flagellimonas aquimarina]|uniref:Zinc-binding alcohol dehydrogenase n=1 Tax=Flagellimonas aquimarina TaxID=2201895 RepID=A0A316KZN1_9FLAO|nr:zinc-binding alcohol dehydrogenase [Allomuricauda koreensis]PWL38285.1 zinc-binding alcohol dehydrogenase [Allomuricauda koreensis]
MKVKEIPVSLFHHIKLSNRSKEKLIEGKNQIPVIVSLASIPSRLHIVDLTIKSILNQDVLPKQIILWLHEDLKNNIPKKLLNLTGSIFSIKFSSYTSSHRKLVETLNIFPNMVIVTCDDDMMYRKNWLSKLYQFHQKNPTEIIGNQTRCITYNNGELLSYKEWRSGSKPCPNQDNTLPIGAGGTLYPIHCLDNQVYDQKLFMKLAPKADDLWFKAMGLLKGTKSIKAEDSGKEPIPIWGSQKVSLKKTNITEDKNRIQWQALDDHFNFKLK